MHRCIDDAFALIGRYVVLSIVVAAGLLIRAEAVPLWCAFPLTTIWMIITGALKSGRPSRR